MLNSRNLKKIIRILHLFPLEKEYVFTYSTCIPRIWTGRRGIRPLLDIIWNTWIQYVLQHQTYLGSGDFQHQTVGPGGNLAVQEIVPVLHNFTQIDCLRWYLTVLENISLYYVLVFIE